MAIKKITYRSIKVRFISYLLQVMAWSIAIFILTALVLLSLVDVGVIRRADYYEDLVPSIKSYIQQQKSDLLNPEAKWQLEEIIETQGMSYKVYDTEGKVLYQHTQALFIPDIQWDTKGLLIEQKQLIGSVSGKVIRYFPIVVSGNLQGSVVIAYRIANSSHIEGLNWIAGHMDFILLILPFIYLFLFIFIYANKFIRSIEKPLQILEQGIEAVQTNDLDFTLQCESQDEIGKLINSFEKMHKTLKETLEANWRAEEERKNLINALAHDLRTPMTIIKGYTEMLLDEEELSGEQAKKGIQAIDKNSDRLMRLIEQINRINKLQQIDYVIEKQTCYLSKVLKGHIEDYKLMVKDKEIIIISEVNLVKDQYNVDEHALIEILDNLMSNSVRFTPEGGRIKIIAKEEQDYLQIIVEDSGCGFSKEDLLQGTKLFYQGDTARSNSMHYGIGLYITMALAQKMQGDMQLYNTAEGGAGACVKIKVDNDVT